MGFGISHQNVGINRCGRFMETAREKGPVVGPESGKTNEPWRRISDLVGKNAETTDPKIRKRCVKKLVNWIGQMVSSERLKIENCELKIANLTEGWGGDVESWAGGWERPAQKLRFGASGWRRRQFGVENELPANEQRWAARSTGRGSRF